MKPKKCYICKKKLDDTMIWIEVDDKDYGFCNNGICFTKAKFS